MLQKKTIKKKLKVWKEIDFGKLRLKKTRDVFSFIDKKNIYISPWIIDIFKNKKNKFILPKFKVYLYIIKVSDLGFKGPTTLEKIYKKLKQNEFKLVNPVIALVARKYYLNQKKGEWLRFATPFNSMIDQDNVPHLPKLGSALGKLFIETYWSYKKAIFHPHNQFVVELNDRKKNKN